MTYVTVRDVQEKHYVLVGRNVSDVTTRLIMAPHGASYMMIKPKMNEFGRVLSANYIDDDTQKVNLSAQEAIGWKTDADTPLMDYLYGVDKIPSRPTTLLVIDKLGEFYVYDPKAFAQDGRVRALHLESGTIRRFESSDQLGIIGTTHLLTKALKKWSRPGSSAYFLGMYGLSIGGASVASGSVAPLIGLSLFPMIAGFNYAMRLKFHAQEVQQNEALEASYQAPSPAPVVALNASLVQRLSETIAAFTAPRGAQDILAQLASDGSYVLERLDKLGGQLDRDEATALLLDHLPKAMELYSSALQHTVTPGAVQESEQDLVSQLRLIAIEATSLRTRIESEVRRQQKEFGSFLDAKLRRSDLD